MTERPILFSGPMVRAIIEGRKSQTRRVVKPQPGWMTPIEGNPWPMRKVDWPADGRYDIGYQAPGPDGLYQVIVCPYGQPGDRLWVRETWAHDGPDLATVRARNEDMLLGGDTYGPYYRATEVAPETLRWIPAIHMPRWACRLVLDITAVRVERLQEISREDEIAEGCPDGTHFDMLWDSINAKRCPWSSNPWVWVVEFRVAPQHAPSSTRTRTP